MSSLLSFVFSKFSTIVLYDDLWYTKAAVTWCLAGVVLFVIAVWDMSKPKNFPPGPFWLPVIGSILSLNKMREKTGYLYRATEELAKQYGPVLGLRVGKDVQVVCCGYQAIKEMLTKEEFDGRPRGPFYETRTWGARRGLLLTDEQFWQEQRRFMMRHLREFGFGKKTMSELIEEEAAQLMKLFEKKLRGAKGLAADGNNNEDEEMKAAAIIEMRDVFTVSVLNALWYMLAGIRYSPEDEELKTLQSLMTDLFANIDMVGALFSQFPFLRYVAPNASGYNDFLAVHKRLWTFFRAELDKHKDTLQDDFARDIMDVYLQTLQSQPGKTDTSFSESQLLAICMDLFMAGSETTNKSLGFGFLYMLLYPDVQKKAQEEIDRVVGYERAPTLNDRPNMPYIEATVLESIRMFMGRSFGVPHRALKDTTLQGFFIPKETMLVANFASVLMDKETWGDPEVFRPDRFIDSEGNVNIPEQYLPFGYGKHRCMGEALARSNIFLFIASLLQKFDFSIPSPEDTPSTLGVDGVTPSPRNFKALVTYRKLPMKSAAL